MNVNGKGTTDQQRMGAATGGLTAKERGSVSRAPCDAEGLDLFALLELFSRLTWARRGPEAAGPLTPFLASRFSEKPYL